MTKNISSIEQQANELSEQYGLNKVFPVPLAQIANNLGFEVIELDLGSIEAFQGAEDVSGLVAHQEKRIYLNVMDSDLRKRFTLAHEIGHIKLHGDLNNYVDFRQTISTLNGNPKEVEANQFAAALLMPEEYFTRVWHAVSGDLLFIGEYFGVSLQAASIRAERLGLSK